ncbi:hypothetical protein KCP74_16240 [Salmonella enterica subsp. enterica]|nr:hypothetical protein KCP74_16240 [Salmonella enterica subsp. enterica]
MTSPRLFSGYRNAYSPAPGMTPVREAAKLAQRRRTLKLVMLDTLGIEP